MTTHAADLSEWAAAFCLGTACWVTCCCIYFLLLPVDFAAAGRAATDAAREAWVQTALTLAALLILTIPTGDHS